LLQFPDHAVYGSADAVGSNRIVFNICGNHYRRIVQFNYVAQVAHTRRSHHGAISMNIHPIKTSEDHKAALDRIDELMDAEAGTPEVAELEVLAILVERYEHDAFPIDPPSALDAIQFRMEQAGYRQTDLADLLGSRSRASEIMRGSAKRLSLTQIRRLHEAWKIPADVLIRDVTPPTPVV
jgi:HTH-type transcriptional regulator/antitoxin HigA